MRALNSAGVVSAIDPLFVTWHPDGQSVVVVTRNYGLAVVDMRKMKLHKKPSIADELDVSVGEAAM